MTNSNHTPTPLRINVCPQHWNVMHQPWVALVFSGREVIARGFGDTEDDAVRAALAKVEG